MGKKTKHSVALVIYNNDRTKYLLVRRPLDDDSLPGYWGFPASSKESLNETWEEVVEKTAKIKLGVKIKIIKLIGEDEIDRGEYILKLRDYEVEIIEGKIKVPQDQPNVTQYIDFKWTDETEDLVKSAKLGSLCSRIFLKNNNIKY